MANGDDGSVFRPGLYNLLCQRLIDEGTTFDVRNRVFLRRAYIDQPYLTVLHQCCGFRRRDFEVCFHGQIRLSYDDSMLGRLV